MNLELGQIITAVSTTGVLLYLAQYLFPSLQLKVDADAKSTETELATQEFALDIGQRYRIMAEEANAREKAHWKIIQENRNLINELQQERQTLLDELRIAQSQIVDLQKELKLEKEYTSTFPYIDTIAEIYDVAIEEDSIKIVTIIKSLADKRPSIREALTD